MEIQVKEDQLPAEYVPESVPEIEIRGGEDQVETENVQPNIVTEIELRRTKQKKNRTKTKILLRPCPDGCRKNCFRKILEERKELFLVTSTHSTLERKDSLLENTPRKCLSRSIKETPLATRSAL
ncbi:hypothetical protein HHI36_000199 [Cryptolaemus montrouzieri]|uniref:Uncharacterized protein n=1 Tax=Cryptolaemus montrouzieri TaxID=559131 RepID=A0ABD2P3X7_9CUCU